MGNRVFSPTSVENCTKKKPQLLDLCGATGWEPGPTAPGSPPALLPFAPPARRCLFCIADGEGVYFASCMWQHCPAALPPPCLAGLSGVLQTAPQKSGILQGAQLLHSPGADRPPSLQPALCVLLINTGWGKHETCHCFASFSLCAGPARGQHVPLAGSTAS